MFDRVDGGIPALFLDGPKKGHVGVVTPDHLDQPPASLSFLHGQVIYQRKAKTKVKGRAATGQARRYDGVSYALAPDCPIAKDMERLEAEAKAQRELQL